MVVCSTRVRGSAAACASGAGNWVGCSVIKVSGTGSGPSQAIRVSSCSAAALLRARTAHHHSPHGGWAAMVVRLLRAAVPGNVWNNPPVWPTWRPLLPHVLAATDPTRTLDEVLAEVSWLLRKAGDYVQSRGEPHAARPLFDRAYRLNRDRLDAEDPDMLDTSVDLAIVLSAIGEHEQARALTEKTLTRRRRVLGEDHPETLHSAHTLAIGLAELGEHEQAAELREWIARHQSS